MKIKGINAEVRNNSMALALLKRKEDVKKCGYELAPKRASWPRVKGPVGTRKDVSTGFAVSFVQ
jgi:hypothetical protein